MRIFTIFFLSLILTACLIPTTTSTTKTVDLKSVGVIAVLPFSGYNGALFADNITNEMIRSGARIVDRAKINSVLREQGLNVSNITSGVVPLDKIGGLLGVDVIVTGSVAPIIVYDSGAPSGKVSSATVRLISVKTGEIIALATFEANTEHLLGSELYHKTAHLLVNAIAGK